MRQVAEIGEKLLCDGKVEAQTLANERHRFGRGETRFARDNIGCISRGKLQEKEVGENDDQDRQRGVQDCARKDSEQSRRVRHGKINVPQRRLGFVMLIGGSELSQGGETDCKR